MIRYGCAFGYLIALLLVAADFCSAQTYHYNGTTAQPQWTHTSAVPTVTYAAPVTHTDLATSPATDASTPAVPISGSGLAQQKASQAANLQVRGHLGGGLGGAQYEGVGWSNQSPQAALQNCCYWGTRPVAQMGVARAADGCWYACVLYR